MPAGLLCFLVRYITSFRSALRKNGGNLPFASKSQGKNRFYAMHDNDFLKWRRLDGMGFFKRPAPGSPADTSFLRIPTDRYPRNASFEERLTFEDKLFLESVGIAVTR